MTRKLTAKQDAFARDVFEGINATDAYRNNYNTKNMSDNTIWKEASKLLHDPKVAPRIAELQAEAAKASQVTVESITKELEEARELARGEGHSATMVSASLGKAKVNGLLVDKVEAKVNHTPFEGFTLGDLKPDAE